MKWFFCFSLLILSVQCAMAEERNSLTRKEREVGFELLFNGRDFKNWKQSGNWEIQEDAIARVSGGGSLVYDKSPVPDDFELKFEWKVGPASNSGIYYRPTQYEYQILSNEKHRDGQNPRTSAASLYFCMAPSKDNTKPAGEWNTGRIVCKGTVIQHWLNGEAVIDFDYTDPQWAENVKLLKRRGGDLNARGAKLSFQDHGDPVWYRNIKLREITNGEEVTAGDFQPAEIDIETLKKEREKIEGIESRRKKQN